jgi:hypothetical protein
MAERIKAQYLDSLLSTPEEFRKMLAADVGKWNRIVKTSGAKVDRRKTVQAKRPTGHTNRRAIGNGICIAWGKPRVEAL